MEFSELLPLLNLNNHLENGLSLDDSNQLQYISEHYPYHIIQHESHMGDPVHNFSDSLTKTTLLFHTSTLTSLTSPQTDKRYHLEDPSRVMITESASHHDLDQLPLRLPLWGIIILIVGYAIVFLIGVVGNCSVLFIVVRLKRMKTVTNYFILNLAISDLLVLLFCLLPNLVSNIFIPWVLGWFLCKAVSYIQGVSVWASIYFLVAISLERCIAIQWPFKYQITKEKAKIIICSIWLWSSIVALPWALFFQTGAFDEANPHLEFCIEIWPDNLKEWQNYYFFFGNLFLCYIFPLTVILICYLTIWVRVYRRAVPCDCYHEAMKMIYQRSKMAVVKMLTIICLIFALSWLPLYAIVIRVKFGSESMSELEASMISIVYPIAQFLLATNSCLNPIVYNWIHPSFRKAFLGIISNRKSRVRIKHKSPTVNILLKRFSTYRVETTISNNNIENSYDSV